MHICKYLFQAEIKKKLTVVLSRVNRMLITLLVIVSHCNTQHIEFHCVSVAVETMLSMVALSMASPAWPATESACGNPPAALLKNRFFSEHMVSLFFFSVFWGKHCIFHCSVRLYSVIVKWFLEGIVEKKEHSGLLIQYIISKRMYPCCIKDCVTYVC